MARPTVEQRYRAQVAAMPVRRGPRGVEVLLITSRESHRWIIPKGWPIKGCKDRDAAAREALEEAGVAGRIHKHPIGAYTYPKRLGDRVASCRVMIYVLEVDRQLLTWRERDERKRRWFGLEEAAAIVSEPRLASIMQSVGRSRFAVGGGRPVGPVPVPT